jgi:hypothetical protein
VRYDHSLAELVRSIVHINDGVCLTSVLNILEVLELNLAASERDMATLIIGLRLPHPFDGDWIAGSIRRCTHCDENQGESPRCR